jgi:hypothetical protein
MELELDLSSCVWFVKIREQPEFTKGLLEDRHLIQWAGILRCEPGSSGNSEQFFALVDPGALGHKAVVS